MLSRISFTCQGEDAWNGEDDELRLLTVEDEDEDGDPRILFTSTTTVRNIHCRYTEYLFIP